MCCKKLINKRIINFLQEIISLIIAVPFWTLIIIGIPYWFYCGFELVYSWDNLLGECLFVQILFHWINSLLFCLFSGEPERIRIREPNSIIPCDNWLKDNLLKFGWYIYKNKLNIYLIFMIPIHCILLIWGTSELILSLQNLSNVKSLYGFIVAFNIISLIHIIYAGNIILCNKSSEKNDEHSNNNNILHNIIDVKDISIKQFQENISLDYNEYVNVPDHYKCPISQHIMTDPVVCSDGHTYERSYIEKWFSKKNTSPLTNKILPNTSRRCLGVTIYK